MFPLSTGVRYELTTEYVGYCFEYGLMQSHGHQ